MGASELLMTCFIVFALLGFLKYRLSPETALRLNTWYHILSEKRETYDFERLLEREKKVYSLMAIVSLIGYFIEKFASHTAGLFFIFAIFISLIFLIYYLYPKKTNR
ncbi:DUF3784 domain-containing protein [Amphibacillus sp. Q70]|uniref:DUF3784 domain-containing protein n=1 Tax=Amphibacillus sp. Q70 TaxID=3453416 RepID=UPI003F839AE0